MSTVPTSPLSDLTASHHQSEADFLRWAIDQIQHKQTAPLHGQNSMPLQGAEIVQLELSEEDQANFDGQSALKISFTTTTPDSKFEQATLDSRFGRWLMQKLQADGNPISARPMGQPQAVQNITATLFSAYQITGGQLHLGGCQLTDYPFLRLSYRASAPLTSEIPDPGTKESPQSLGEQPSSTGGLFHLFVGPDGSWVPHRMVQELGLLEIEPIDELPPRIDKTTLTTLLSAGGRMTSQMGNLRDPSAKAIEPIATTLIWVKHADGHLQFTLGEASTNLPFSDWAKLLKPPPYQGEYSGVRTFHLAATDDGQIDAWEQIKPCEISGKRVLKKDLFLCNTTGKQVLEEYIEICPVSGNPCLIEEFSSCNHCQQQVSKAVLQEGRCSACEKITKLPKEDPRLLWLLGEHPGLNRWKHWKLAETGHVYIVEASRLFKQLLIVADKQSLDVQFLATSNIASSRWKEVPNSAVPKYLS